MVKSPVFVLLTLVACSSPPVAEPDQPRNGWRGFAPGSWVVVALSGSPYRDELVGTDAAGDPMLRSTFKFSPTSSPFFSLPRTGITSGMVEQSRRRETLSIDGRTLKCSVVDYALEGKAALTLWKADGVRLPPWDMVGMRGRQALPADVVRASLRTATMEATLELEEFQSTIAIGGRRIECVVGRSSSIATTGSGSRILRSWRTWLSPEIPGGIARRDRQCADSPDARPHDYTTRDQVTEFNAVR